VHQRHANLDSRDFIESLLGLLVFTAAYESMEQGTASPHDRHVATDYVFGRLRQPSQLWNQDGAQLSARIARASLCDDSDANMKSTNTTGTSFE
jgi:hypothetical protein